MLLKEYRGTLKRLEFEDEVLGNLDTRTSLRADQYVRNREGSLLTAAGDGVRYIVKRWFSDRECDIRDGYEIRKALSRLAMLHSQLRGIPRKRDGTWDPFWLRLLRTRWPATTGRCAGSARISGEDRERQNLSCM